MFRRYTKNLIITAGFPCQDASIAGGREGLAGARTGLFTELARIIDEVKPEWFILENVPGLLSVNKGRDMAFIIATLSEIGYCVAWRILDAQFFGVAQRRRRLWIVGSFGDTRSAEVLFEQAGSRGNVKAVKKIRQRRLHISSTTKARDGRTNNATDTYIASTIRGCDFNSATARGQTNFVAQTINAGKRGNAGRIWEDTYIAETDADREGKTDGI